VASKLAEQKQRVIDLAGKPGTTQQELIRALKGLLDFNPDSLGDGANQWKR
jgi:hypothetical protein